MCVTVFFFFQAEDGIRDLVRSRGLGDVYKRQRQGAPPDGKQRAHRQDRASGEAMSTLQIDIVSDLSLIHI